MYKYKKYKPLDEQLSKILLNKATYQQLRIPLPVFLINMNESQATEDVMYHLLQVLKTHNLREFNSYTEFENHKLTQKSKSVDSVFNLIYENSVYTNEFEGLVGIDISCLNNMLKDEQCTDFFEQIVELAKTSTIVLFNCDLDNRNKDRLMEKISRNFYNLKVVTLDDSVIKNHVENIFAFLDKYNVKYSKEDLTAPLTKLLDQSDFNEDLDFQLVQEKVLFCVDVTGCENKLDSAMLEKLLKGEK